MWKFRRFRKGSELEGILRSHRADARDDFVDELSSRLNAEPDVRRRSWSRVVFAAAVSTFILGTFASFGGLGYAASGAGGTYQAVKQVAVKHTLIVSVHKSSASDQYAPKPKKKKHIQAGGVAGKQTAVGGVAGVQSSGTLPFTGLSLLTTFVVSLALIGAGLALRRRERKN